ncbi:hypothetical protein QR680_014371 [Steinernema hermaphroditum]|uniref:Uncharacterized protein n=1 Tax=Steinernema hermaphroditum TaxID=289476 RepID=A0AA39I8M6_9BILA|nr:hypothetical protein QR680_014371 [Steinernema hermaphroditum]
MLEFGTDGRFNSFKVNKVGFCEKRLYVSPKRSDRLEIWSVECEAGKAEWELITCVNFDELLLSYYALDSANRCVYVLTVGVFENGNEVPCIALFKISIPGGTYEVFQLDPASGLEFEENVFLDNVVLGCTKGTLFMYDRTVVMGTIPFWRIELNEIRMDFGIEPQFVKDIESTPRCTRFPLVLDGKNRVIVKLTASNDVFVFDQHSNAWVECCRSGNSDLFLVELRDSRGLSETYGRHGHRIGAVESPLSLYADGNFCIAKVLDKGVHVFYHFVVDVKRKTYKFLFMKSIKLNVNLNKRFYLLCALPKMVFLNPRQIAVYDIEPLSLEELAFLSIQRHYRVNPETNEVKDRLTVDEIKQIMIAHNQKRKELE